MLPELGDATKAVGTVTADFADASGLSPETVVAIGCGDEMAATLGAGVFEPGEVCDVVGTAEPVCAASAEPREDPTMLVECHPHADPDAWLLENPGFVSGGNLRWWRDQFAPEERRNEEQGLGDAYDQLSEEASKVPAGSDGVIFLPAMQGAMAPEWNGAARGVFYGLTLAHTRDHMTRAILEGSAFALRDILEAMKASGLGVRRLTIVGGGAKGPLWRQIKADVTGLPVRVPESVETTATGAAILAAVGSGVHASVADAVDAFVSFRPDEHEPDPPPPRPTTRRTADTASSTSRSFRSSRAARSRPAGLRAVQLSLDPAAQLRQRIERVMQGGSDAFGSVVEQSLELSRHVVEPLLRAAERLTGLRRRVLAELLGGLPGLLGGIPGAVRGVLHGPLRLAGQLLERIADFLDRRLGVLGELLQISLGCIPRGARRRASPRGDRSSSRTALTRPSRGSPLSRARSTGSAPSP